MEIEKEEFGSCFPDVKPGWVYDSDNRAMSSKTSVLSERTPVKFESTSLSQSSLEELLFEDKDSSEYVWQKEFEDSDEKKSFILRFTSSFTDSINSPSSSPKGTVTKVNYKRSIVVLVCSNDEKAFDVCSAYINNIIEGTEAKLDDKTCESCKKCFVYDGHNFYKRNMRSFNSIVHCSKEVSRIIDDMKNYENFFVNSWMFIKENSFYQDTKPLRESSTNETSFYNTKLFNSINTREKVYSPALHSFGNDSCKKPRDLRKSYYSSIIIPIKSDNINESNNSASHNPDYVLNSYVNVNEDSTLAKKLDSLTNKFSNLSEATAGNASKTSLYNEPAHEAIAVKKTETEKNPSPITVSSDSNIEIEVNKIPANDINKSGSVSMSTGNSHHSVYINASMKKTEGVKTSINSSVHEDKTKGSAVEESNDNYDTSNVKGIVKVNLICDRTADKNDNNEHSKKQIKINTKKRYTVAERISLNGPSMLDSSSINQRQVKRHKKKNFIEYRGKKIAQSVVEENCIRKVEIGTKANEKKGKVIVLLGATGSGKTSIVNLCANFYFGAQNADDEKLFVVDSKLKSDRVTVYTFYPEGETQHSLTVVDTPGLNDSTGAEIHDHVDALKSFLALACSQGMEINALCFVAQAHLVRLTSSEKLVMDYVKSLFGSEVEKHIMALVTFSDNQPTPPVIEAMEQYGFASPFFVKFNNTLLISKTETVDELDKIYWRTGLRSWKKCLKHLSAIGPLSNVAISSVKNEVFNKSVLNKYSSCLEGEIHSFVTMCRKKKKVEEFYSDKKLLCARKKVWMALNDAFNVEANIPGKTKEIFLNNACQFQLKNEKNPELSAVIKLFLLLDNESTMRCVLKTLVTALVQSLGIFSKHPKAQENSLVSFCNGCNEFCHYRKYSDYEGSGNVTKFICKCRHVSGLHGPQQNDLNTANSPPLPFITRQHLFSYTAHLIKKKISKYVGINCDDASLWNVVIVLQNMLLNEPDEFGNKKMNDIFITLGKYA